MLKGLVEALEDLGLELAARLAEGLRGDHLGLGRGLVEHAIELIELGLQGGAWLIEQKQDEVLEGQLASAGKVVRALAVGIDEVGTIELTGYFCTIFKPGFAGRCQTVWNEGPKGFLLCAEFSANYMIFIGKIP